MATHEIILQDIENIAEQQYPTNYNQHEQRPLKRAFTEGALFYKEKSINTSIDFVDWLHHNQFERYLSSKNGPVPFGPNKHTNNPVWVSTKIKYSPGFYTSSELYELWQESI